MSPSLRILIIEDSPSDAEWIIRLISRGGFSPIHERVETEEEMRKALGDNQWDIVLSDFSMPGFDALSALKVLQESGSDIPFIVVSGAIGEDTAVSIMKAGAHDYLMKDNLARLIPAIDRELREARMRREKKKSQEDLVESLEQYQFLFRHMAQGVVYLDGLGRIISANTASERILGLPKEEMIGLTCMSPGWKAIREDGSDYPGETHPAMIALKTGQEIMNAIMGVFNPKAGEYRWISINAVPQFRKGAPLPYQVFATFNDITDLKNTEQSLRDSEKMLTRAQQIAHIGHWRLNPKTEEVTGSDELSCIFSIHNNFFTFDQFTDVIRPDQRDFAVNTFRKALSEQKSFDTEYWLVCPDNTQKYIKTIGEPVFDLQGQMIQMVGTVQDITERKLAEEERQKLAAQLRHAQRMEAIGQLAGGIAHDFNNLLYVITGYVEIILDDLKPEDPIHHSVQQIMKAAQRATNLVRQLLLFSRKEAMQPRILDLNELIGNLMKMLRRMIGENITLEVHPGFDLKSIYADPGQIEQVIVNLCVNSRDAMPDGGKITIQTENCVIDADFCELHPWAQKGQFALLTISDTGLGIPREIQDHVFEPFFTTKEVGKGTGLGLAAVYGIVKAHKGMIHLYSEPDQGTVFKIYFPLARMVLTSAGDGEEFIKPQEGRRETVLVAEDEQEVRSMIITLLIHAGYKVLSAEDGDEAISLFDRHASEIDVALLDVVMPKASGKKVLDHIKASRPNMPVLFLTGYSKGVLGPSISPDSQYEIIQKPLSRSVLLRKLRDILDKG